MSQPTVTARPATWSGTSNPILYKFTSTNYTEAGYRMEVEIWNSTTAAKIADANYYPNSTGNLTVDISSFLKANMSLLNNSDLTSGSVYTDNNWINYYIKYQEVWTASSETQVNDSGNARFAIYGGLQVGVINSFVNYIPGDSAKRFLRFAGRAAQGFPFTISSIIGASTIIQIDKYLNSVFIAGSAYSPLTSGVSRFKINETAYDRVDFTLLDESTATFTNGQAIGSVFPFDSLAVSTGVAAAGLNAIHRAYAGTIDVPINITVRVTSTDVTGDVVMRLSLLDAPQLIIRSLVVPVTYNGLYVLSFSTDEFTPAWLQFSLTNDSAGSVDWEIEVFDDVASETVSIEIEEECNTVMLQWKNSLGGDECFPFCCNQEYTFHYSDRKAKRLTLYADNLTLAQWEAIQGLNTIGELYKTPIVELTASIDRTMATIGQAVYVLNSDGTKTGVNVIGSPNTTNTKQKKHSAFVTIEYPEQFLQ